MISIQLESTKDLLQYKLSNKREQHIQISGNGKAVAPMETVLMAIASCSTVDVVQILKKMRQELKHIEVRVDGERREEIPRIYTGIHVHYIVYGPLKEKKVKKAIDLSLDKYCSVTKMIEKTTKITSSFEIKEASDEI